jgi:hypothetical protein
MLKIISPNNFTKERKYIIGIFFKGFLGLEYELLFSDQDNYKILFDDKCITIEDHFFNKFNKQSDYLSKENIPDKVQYIRNNLILEENLVVIYGRDVVDIKKLEILIGVDIFASSFFMLSRWEEYVIDKKDNHERFLYSEALAFKESFLDRPVVNEYVEFLWNCLQKMNFKQDRRQKKFRPILTHDIDRISSKTDFRSMLKTLKHNIVNKNVAIALNAFLTSILIKFDFIKDPFFCFDWIMEQSERNNLRSSFYFMSGGKSSRYDNKYSIKDKKLSNVFKSIVCKGHIVGFHPSYHSFNDRSQFYKEKKLLEKVSGTTIATGRQHYLKFSVPNTWRIWEDNNMLVDSTMGYSECAGFRCGTGDGFKVFDVCNRIELKLVEYPLIFMDATYRDRLSEEETFNIVKFFIDVSKKYRMDMVILFHNSVLYNGFNMDMKNLYLKVLKELRECR